jgi:hypothetical protein
MINNYYKKSKIQQLKSFCTVVEFQMSLTKASQKLNISISSISLHIKSLEYDLDFKLFDRKGKKLFLTDKGQKYYKEAKNALLAMDIAYNGKLKINKTHYRIIFFKNYVANMRNVVSKYLYKIWYKMYIKITFKRVFIFLLAALFLVYFYLLETNWFFDRKLERLASPLLREVMEVGHYRLDKDILCSNETIQIHYDFNELNLNLINNGYDIELINIGILECPVTQLRMNGDEKTDKLLFQKSNNKCDMDKRYIGYSANASQLREILQYPKIKFYNLYSNKNCLNNNVFLNNAEKYKGKIFKFFDATNTSPQGWHRILKYNNYYYLLSITTGLQPDNKNFSQDHYLIFKKLTLKQLMKYDNGSYWKLINEYNIKID